MMFRWLQGKDIDEFADALVADLRQRFPSTGVDASTRKGSARLAKTHQVLFTRVRTFAQGNRLNLYRKARLGNRVKWALREANYPEPFIDAFVHELLTTVVMASRKDDQIRR